MKMAIIGAGSTYTPELIEGLIHFSNTMDVTELALMDIDERKLRIVGAMAQRMIAHSCVPCQVMLTMDLTEALTGCTFVMAQIRVGKLPARHLDETIPLKYGLIGQETMGMGGFFNAQRTIPALLDIAARMEKVCPNAFLINFSNPSGMVAEALLKYRSIRTIGLCNVPYNMKKSLREKMSLSDEAYFEFVGLNHLCWITDIRDGEVSRMQEALEKGLSAITMKNIPSQGFAPELIRATQGIPSPYLEYVYMAADKFEKIKNAGSSRAQDCMQIEETLLKMYEDTTLCEKPKLLEKRGGANYSLCAISLANAIYNDLKDVQIVNTQNKGCIPYLADDDVVEIACVIDRNGATPIPVKHAGNEHIRTLVSRWKAYEHYTVKAAVTGDRDAAICAILSNPIISNYYSAIACFDEMLEAHKEYLPQYAFRSSHP